MTTPTMPLTASATRLPSASTAPPARATTGTFWRRTVYDLVAVACVLFMILTALAMRLYPGGTIMDPASMGYRFFENYFSDLGLTRARSDAVNVPAMLLFMVALIGVALALGAFFVAFTRLFAAAPRALRLSRRAAYAGTITYVSFIGVAASPRDVFYVPHIAFELLAFPSFLVAVAFEMAALRALRHCAPPGLPCRLLWVFAAFALVLAGYIALLAFGPPDGTLVGERVQVTGQKLIVYAAIATILVQAIQARWLASRDVRAGE